MLRSWRHRQSDHRQRRLQSNAIPHERIKGTGPGVDINGSHAIKVEPNGNVPNFSEHSSSAKARQRHPFP